MLGPVPARDLVTLTDRTIPGPDGAPEVPVMIYQPKNADGPLGCLVDYHGGAFIFGSAKMDHPANVRIASQLGIVVVSVDYRLAPEHPFPAGVDDCYAGSATGSTRTPWSSVSTRPGSRSAAGAPAGHSPLPSR